MYENADEKTDVYIYFFSIRITVAESSPARIRAGIEKSSKYLSTAPINKDMQTKDMLGYMKHGLHGNHAYFVCILVKREERGVASIHSK